MRFSTPISSVPVSSKGQVGIRGSIAPGVYSDVFLKAIQRDSEGRIISDATVDGFNRIFKYGSAVGYTDFTPFIDGYYDYQTALFKMTMERVGDTGIPEVTRLAVIVDVPDVIESGTVKTDSENWTLVKLKKKFYTIPTVTATQQSGTDIAVPKVKQNALNASQYPGNEYFYVALETQAGDKIQGNVYWQAVGY